MAKMSLEQEAWTAGVEAGMEGVPSRQCPYPAPSPKSHAWISGYIEGKAWRHGADMPHPITGEARDQRASR